MKNDLDQAIKIAEIKRLESETNKNNAEISSLLHSNSSFTIFIRFVLPAIIGGGLFMVFLLGTVKDLYEVTAHKIKEDKIIQKELIKEKKELKDQRDIFEKQRKELLHQNKNLRNNIEREKNKNENKIVFLKNKIKENEYKLKKNIEATDQERRTLEIKIKNLHNNLNNAKKEKNNISNELGKITKRDQAIRKNIDLRFFPKSTNILVFNASKSNKAHTDFETIIRKNSSISNINSTWEWMQRYEMEVTRIYYLNDKAELLANSLNSVLPGEQVVIDYRKQSIMAGIREDRDLVIFVGNDLASTLIPIYLP